MTRASAYRQRPGHRDLLRRVAHPIVAGLVLERARDEDRPGLLAGGDGDRDLDAEWTAVHDLRLTPERGRLPLRKDGRPGGDLRLRLQPQRGRDASLLPRRVDVHRRLRLDL